MTRQASRIVIAIAVLLALCAGTSAAQGGMHNFSKGINPISFPCDTTVAAVSTVLSHAVTRAITWENGFFTITNAFKRGRGYFIILDSSFEADISGVCAASYSQYDYTFSLTKGWNLIGNPYSTDETLSLILQNNLASIGNSLFSTTFHPVQMELSDKLAVNSAVWLYSGKTGSYTVDTTLTADDCTDCSWVYFYPIQCGANPWNLFWKDNTGDFSSGYDVIKDYFGITKGMEVYDVRTCSPDVFVCLACDCWDGSILSILVKDEDAASARTIEYSYEGNRKYMEGIVIPRTEVSSACMSRCVTDADCVYDPAKDENTGAEPYPLTGICKKPDTYFAYCDYQYTDPSLCGNGVIDIEWGEECDHGGSISGDGCSQSCTVEQTTHFTADTDIVSVDDLHGFVQNADGSYAVSGFEYGDSGENVVFLKLDNSGDVTINKTYPGGNFKDIAIGNTSDGGYILGASSGTANSVPYLLKLDSAGNKLWDSTNQIRSYVRDVRELSDGLYLATLSANQGVWEIAADSHESTWTQLYPTGYYFINENPDAGTFLLSVTATVAGAYSSKLAKIGPDGAIEWEKTFSLNFSTVKSFVATIDGGFIVAGSIVVSSGNVDAKVVKLDGAGNVEWEKTFGGLYPDGATYVWQARDGSYLAGGTRQRSLYGGEDENDMWISLLSETGKMKWYKMLASDRQGILEMFQDTPDGKLVILGTLTAGIQSVFNNRSNLWIQKLSIP